MVELANFVNMYYSRPMRLAKSNMAKLNAAYTPEKRKAAAEKRRATMEAKKRQK